MHPTLHADSHTPSFPVVPGQVENPVCPNSPDGGVLNIRWQQPSINAGSVNDYVVEVQEIIHSPPGSRMLGLRTLTPPFQQAVQSGRALMTVTSGVGEFLVMPQNCVTSLAPKTVQVAFWLHNCCFHESCNIKFSTCANEWEAVH